MRLLISTAAVLFAATAAQAGGLSSAGDPVVTKPGSMTVKHPECTGILVGGCGYCIGGKVYFL